MITERKIKTEVARYKAKELAEGRNARKVQYCKLVEKFGIVNVSYASGLNTTTLIQYLRAESPNIGYEPLAQALAVLGKFDKD